MAWVKDFFEVDLNHVESPNFGKDWKGSKGHSRQEIEAWTRQLGEIQALSREKGHTYEDFARMRSSTDASARALGETHHQYYDHANNTHLKLVWDGNRYGIDNGNHRIFSAKQAGLRTVPAQVSAQEEHIEQCRAQGFRTPLLSPADRVEPGRSVLRGPSAGAPGKGPERPLWERGSSASPSRKDRLDR